MTEEENSKPVEIPHAELAPETLRAVIESFVLREGTDYGDRDATLESKVTDVRRQLERREAVIVFDPETEGIDIVPVRASLMRR